MFSDLQNKMYQMGRNQNNNKELTEMRGDVKNWIQIIWEAEENCLFRKMKSWAVGKENDAEKQENDTSKEEINWKDEKWQPKAKSGRESN